MSLTETPNFIWHEGADSNSLAENLAGELVLQINSAIAKHGNAVIALSGGSTPKPLFHVLAEHAVDWSKVIITLVDERWVPDTHELSNAAFIEQHLLAELHPTACFVPMYREAQTVEASCPLVLADYCAATHTSVLAPRAFDVVVLGMGADGHTASFFPDAENVTELVSIDASNLLQTCESPSTQVPRITWSLPTLLKASFVALHFTGRNKRDVFDMALEGGSATELPIRSAIFQDHRLINVYYAD